MTYDDIYKMWEVDGPIDMTNAGSASGETPRIHNKYYRMYVEEGLKLKKLKTDYKLLTKLKTEYYNGSISEEDLKEHGWKPNPLRILKTDIPIYLEADKDIQNLTLKIAYKESIVDYLESILKQINNRGFQIRNLIEFEKFRNGGY